MDTLVLRAVAHELDSRLAGRRVRRAGLLNERELGLVLAGGSESEMLVPSRLGRVKSGAR